MNRTFLKVMSIIMIVCAALSIIVSLLGIAGVAVLAAAGYNSAMLYVSIVIAVVGCVIEMMAGVVGVQASGAKPEKVDKAVLLGILVIVIDLISTIIGAVNGSFSALSLCLGLIIPVLYLVSAFMAKKNG